VVSHPVLHAVTKPDLQRPYVITHRPGAKGSPDDGTLNNHEVSSAGDQEADEMGLAYTSPPLVSILNARRVGLRLTFDGAGANIG
jgi:hypothetical protein